MFPLKKNWSEQTLKPAERTSGATEQHLCVLPQGPLAFPGPYFDNHWPNELHITHILDYQHLYFAIASQPARYRHNTISITQSIHWTLDKRHLGGLAGLKPPKCIEKCILAHTNKKRLTTQQATVLH